MVCYVHDIRPLEATTNISDPSLELGRGGAAGGRGKGVGSHVLSMLVRQVAETDSGKGRSIQVRDRLEKHKHEQETRRPSCQLKTQADGVLPLLSLELKRRRRGATTDQPRAGWENYRRDRQGCKSLSSGKSTRGTHNSSAIAASTPGFLQPTAWIRALSNHRGERARPPHILWKRKKKQDESGPACAKVELMGSMCNLLAAAAVMQATTAARGQTKDRQRRKRNKMAS